MNPCGPYGACKQDSYGGYQCDCMMGYTGVKYFRLHFYFSFFFKIKSKFSCEIQINACSSSPCQNNATCTSIANYFSCNCPLGYYGNTCERTINPCQFSKICLNGGTCVSYNMSTTQCLCPSAYTGDMCQFTVACSCINGGVCSSDNLSCKCPSQWTGSDCSIDLDECLSRPCLNNGNCTELPTRRGGGYYCACKNGYTGKQCSTEISV
jgi:hypothetical protein